MMRSFFHEKYQTLLKENVPLEQSMLHHMIIDNVEDLLENSLPLDRAIKYAIKHHQPHFEKIFHCVQSDGNDK